MDRREGHTGGNSLGGAGQSYCRECRKDFVQLGMHNLIVHHSLPERRCTICGMLFRSPKRLCAHLVDHSSLERRCFECDQEFSETLDLLVHLDDHPSEHIYSCLKCGSGFASRFRLLDHGETTCTDNAGTPVSEVPSPVSETESEGYSTADSIRKGKGITVVIGANGFWRHMEAKKRNNGLKENDRNNLNGESAEKQTEIQIPLVDHKPDNDSTDSDLHIAESVGTRDSGNEEMKEDNNNNSNAGETEETSLRPEQLKRNAEEQVSGFRMLNKNKPAQKRRGAGSTPQIFRCRFCKKDLSNKKTLKYHELKHTGDLKYKCAKCDLRFPALYKLREHSETHKPTGAINRPKAKSEPEVEYRCCHCNQWWKRKHQVAQHLSVDSKCCGQDFGCLTGKAEHMEAVHPGERVFKCAKCPATYTTSSQLKRHSVIVHKSALKSRTSFTCPTCKHRTTSLHNLRRHQRRNGCRVPRRKLPSGTPSKQE